MATINDIAAADSYVGNAALGGGYVPATVIDTKPLEELATYTLEYNKFKYQEKKKEADAKVAELADLSKIRLNDLYGKDKDQATQEYNDLIKEAGKYARYVPKNEDDRLKSELGWQTKKRAFMDNYGSGKNRAISRAAQEAEIMNKYTDASRQDAAMRELNKRFNDTDITTPISAMPEYKTESAETPAPVDTDIDVISIGGNDIVNTKGKVFIPSKNVPNANATVLGIKRLYPQKGTSEYEQLSPNEKAQADQQSTVESTGKVWVDAVVPLNEAKNKKGADGKLLYFNEDGTFNDTKFREDYATNTVVLNAYNGLKQMSDNSIASKKQVAAGIFNDKGFDYQLAVPGSIKPEDYDAGIVDFSKDISPTQLVLAGIAAKHPGDTFVKAVQHTGEENDMKKAKDANALGWAQLGLNKEEFALKQKQFESSQVGSETQINGAMERAKRIFGELKGLADKNGVISPDQLRKLNIEQLKYLGTEAPQERDANGVIISAGGFKPLDLSGDKQYAIQLDDKGNVRVLAPKDEEKEISKTKDGRYIGSFDMTKSTNIWNIGTNILNEELTKAGGKELNSYWGIDVTGNTTQNTDVQSSSTKSSSSSSGVKQSGKVINAATIKSLVGKKGYEGYSEQELIDYYKSNGYEIK